MNFPVRRPGRGSLFGLISFGVCAALVYIILHFGFRWYRQSSQVEPLVPGSVIQVQEPGPASNSPKIVYGYVPYWNLLSATPSAALTDVAYFSLTIGAQGEIVESANGELDMGLRRMQAESFTDWLAERAAAQQKVHITFTMLSNDDITAFLASQTAQERAVQNITQVLASYPYSGVNLDVEYAGSATPAQRQAYAAFVGRVRQAMQEQAPGASLTVAIFGSAGSRQLLWDLAALEPNVDHFIMMAYDYHVRSSSVAGPVAPIFGKQNGKWQDDIVTNLRDILLDVPSQKVLLGIPFYGYEWTTTAPRALANTYPRSGLTATYERVIQLLQDPSQSVATYWDEEALSPYLIYRDGSDTQIIYYEDARSLSYKLDLVRQVDLGGVAIWAVGYEGENPELWDVIDSKLGTGSTSINQNR